MVSNISATSLLHLKPSTITEHKIELTEPKQEPIRQKMRRIPFSKRGEFDKMIDEMLEAKLIQPSNSSWSSPIYLVNKQDGSIRFTVDYRLLNNITKKDAHPLPNIDDLFPLLAKSRWFTKLDLFTGYFQIKLDPDTRKYTAFGCERGLFEFLVLPMGLTNAPASFQRAMNEILKEAIKQGFVVVFIDDILIHSNNLEQHLQHVETVINILKKHGLQVKLKKCEIMKQEVKFLGHVIGYEYRKPDPEKIESLYQYKRPYTLTQVQSFLGLAQFYRKFIENFSKIAAPLYLLTTKEQTITNKNNRIEWNENCERAFNELRTKLTSDTVLALPNSHGRFKLDTDACNTGVGAVLSQKINGVYRPIAYFSKQLTKTQQNYSTTEKELFIMVVAMEYFHSFLFGREFDCYVDHQPLSWLLTCKKPNSRLARWLIRISNYTFKIHYKSGKSHTNADALSRWPLPIDDEQVQKEQLLHIADDSEPKLVINLIDLVNESNTNQNQNEKFNISAEEQDKDEAIKWIKELIVENKCDKPTITKFKTNYHKKLYDSYEELSIENSILFLNKQSNNETMNKLLVLPTHLINKTIEKIHSSIFGGHLGVRKTYDKVRLRFYAPSLKKKTIKFIKECLVCQKIKQPQQFQKAKLQPLITNKPLQLITIDIAGPLPVSKEGNVYILVICCHFSKWVELFAIKNTTCDTISKLILSFMLKFGLCINILTDLGTNFQAELLRKIYELLDVNQLRTTAYHPECDGLTERFNPTLKTMISCFVNEHQNDWDELLPFLAFAYNTSTHATTNYTPYEVMFGRAQKIPLDLVIEENLVNGEGVLTANDNNNQDNNYDEATKVDFYVKELKEKFLEVYNCVQNNTDSKVKKTKFYHDRNLKPNDYKVDELVMLNVPKIKQGLSKKLAPKWEGPFFVLEKIGPVNYKIKKANQLKAKIKLVHHNRLKRFFGKLADKTNDAESSDEEKETQGKNQPKSKRKNKTKNDKQSQPIGSQLRDGNSRSDNIHFQNNGNQTQNVTEDCPVPSVQSQKTNNSIQEKFSGDESESSEDETFNPNNYLTRKMATEPLNLRKSTRTRKPVDRLKY
ncbi:unnamed protein product [Brachionus calyciflorus]|uniref:Uncharacterized protein n=1 Tax=Brachionus calyciflorus TaxID=104777 RepID=A0A814BKA2_9BILA|nr:unnamed protein product [Brachionus calyciflorus]